MGADERDTRASGKIAFRACALARSRPSPTHAKKNTHEYCPNDLAQNLRRSGLQRFLRNRGERLHAA